MDVRTLAIYEARAGEWLQRRGALATDTLGSDFRSSVGDGLILDLGCGTGRYLGQLGQLGQLAGPVVGFDAAAAMLALAARHSRPLVRGDLERLPFATGSIPAVFARHSYLHVHRDRLGSALAELRRILRPGGRALTSLISGTYEGHSLPDDDFAGRYFALWDVAELIAAFSAAGFGEVAVERVARRHGDDDLIVRASA